MKQEIPRDRNGIPILRGDDIEEKADEVLRYFDESCLAKPNLVPLSRIMKAFGTRWNWPFVFNKELGTTKEGRKILGRTDLKNRTVFIDPSIIHDDQRFRFTCAHEIAHIVLHRDLQDFNYPDTDEELKWDNTESRTPRQWLEWQANRFAAALLMPRYVFAWAMVKRQLEIGIRRNRGFLYLNDDSGSLRDYQSIEQHLMFIFQTSRTAIFIRLKTLGLLIDQRQSDCAGPLRIGLPRHLSNGIRTASLCRIA